MPKQMIRGCLARLALACCLLGVPAYPSVAQEATTAPTCTGCSKSRQATRQAARCRRPAAPKAAARVVNNEGTWAGASSGPCIMTWRWTIHISNGAITGNKTSGNITRSGSGRGVMVVFGKSYRFAGQFRGNSASGTWTGAKCSGGWTGAKS